MEINKKYNKQLIPKRNSISKQWVLNNTNKKI